MRGVELGKEMQYVCCFLPVFVLYILRWEKKVMNMHKAKRYTQVTCLTCVAAVNNCMRKMFSLLSPSLRNKGARERGRVISWEHFFTLWDEKPTH